MTATPSSATDRTGEGGPQRGAIILQALALCCCATGIVWGGAMVYTVAFPGPGGEWGAIGIFLAYAVDLPVGLLALVVALAVKHGSRRLRMFCLVAAIITICLPLLADGIQRYHTRWKYGLVVEGSSHTSHCWDFFRDGRV